jgi:hypothetical protein
MDQRDVPPHQLAECVLGPVPGKLVEQVTVWNDLHSTVICPRLPEGDNFFKQPVAGGRKDNMGWSGWEEFGNLTANENEHNQKYPQPNAQAYKVVEGSRG